MKGEGSRPLGVREEVKFLEFSSSHMETSRHQFDSFCRKVLRDFSCDIERQRNRQRQREACFSALPEQKMEQLFTKDEYQSDHTYFYVLGYLIKVENGRLAEAIAFIWRGCIPLYVPSLRFWFCMDHHKNLMVDTG